jgi:hypothetical protein
MIVPYELGGQMSAEIDNNARTGVRMEAPTGTVATRSGTLGRTLPLRRKCLYLTLIGLLILVLAEAASQALLYFRYGPSNGSGEAIREYDPLLGWRNSPNLRLANHFGPGKHLSHNSQGFRATTEYTRAIPEGKYRIICLGDSFTFGYTGDDETYPSQMEYLCPKIQTINLGVAGYGVDQAYLSYMRDGVAFKADLLLVAFIENDFDRMLLPTFMTRAPKPQIKLRDGSLLVSNVPVPEWGQNTTKGWLRTFPRSAGLFQLSYKLYSNATNRHDIVPVAERIFDELQAASRARNQKLMLVYLPTKSTDLMPPGRITNRIAAYALEKKIPFFDLTGAFQALSPTECRAHFCPDGHYSALGNRLVAKTLLRELRQLFPADFSACTDSGGSLDGRIGMGQR